MEAGGGGMEDRTGPLRSNDERSLYICSMAFKSETVSYVINSIKLSDLFSSSCSCRFDPDLPTNPNPTPVGGDGDRSKFPLDCSELNHPDNTTTRIDCAACSKGNSELRHRASLTGEYLPGNMGCGVFGSQIVFGGGEKSNLSTVVEHGHRRFGPGASRAIYGFETRDPNPTIKLGGRERMFGKLLEGIPEPLLVEVSGKLYALAGDMMLCHKKKPPYFQVFDPNSKKWSPLPVPSILEPGSSWGDFSYVIVDSFILLSTWDSMVYGFDTSEEEHPKWIEVATPNFFSDGPLPFEGKALLVLDDDEYFMFSYKRKRLGFAIVVYSVAPDHVNVVKKLPLAQVLAEADKLPAEFCGRYSTYDYYFVLIEGRKVCLIMSNRGNRAAKVRIMSLTFEISPRTTKTGRDVKHVHTRFFDCDTRLSHTSHPYHPCDKTLHEVVIGAFVL